MAMPSVCLASDRSFAEAREGLAELRK
jgi:hypothetical protein